MKDTLLKDRKYLRERHRLSHQQIDTWLGENKSGEFVKDKLKQLELVRQFLNITDKLRNNNIPFISIKGPLLSLRLYGDPTVRISCDVDILIDKKYINKTVALMLSEGFEFIHNLTWPEDKSSQQLLTLNHHHIGFFNPKLKLTVEVHWILTRMPAISKKKFNQILADNLTSVYYANRKFVVLNKEFELLYLIVHGAKHGWERLKWLVDIYEYSKQEIRVDLLDNFIVQLKAKRIVSQVNFFLNKFFDSRLPIFGKKRISPYLLHFVEQRMQKEEVTLSKTFREKAKNMRYYWKLFPGLYHKWIWFLVAFARLGDVYNVSLFTKVAYYLNRSNN